MERIVGKFLACLLFFFSSALVAEITMRISDEDGSPLEAVGVGRPFLLLVELQEFTGPQREPAIQNLNKYEHYRTGVQMSTVNGKSSATYTYRCRIDNLGMHTVGPATISGTQEKSQIFSIQVLDQPKYVHQQKKENGSVLFRLSVKPESAVVGQKVIISARFYTTDSRMKLQNITMPNFSSFRVVDKVGPSYGKEKLDGKDYEYTEWCVELYANQPGNQVIPAFSADYEYPSPSRYSGFMWGYFAQTKRVYSNSIRIQVESVPTAAKPVDFIGTNVTVQASANPPQAKIGEGIIYTITFVGEGDLELVKTPVLQDMPDAIKYYDSKTNVIGGTPNQLPKKQFEYILQGMKEGAWEIPPQHFEVFDVNKRQYKTVSTKPVQITIFSGSASSRVNLDADEQKSQNEQIANLNFGSIRPIHQNDPWYPTPERAPLNWSLFFLLVCAPCAYGLLTFARTKFKRPMSPQMRAKKAADKARACLDRVGKTRNFGEVYHLFIVYFADMFEIAPGYVTAEFMHQKLRDAGASDAFIAEWDQFFARMSACTFGSNAGVPDLTLVADGRAWLDKLKELLCT